MNLPRVTALVLALLSLIACVPAKTPSKDPADIPVVPPIVEKPPQTLRILAIGNSFSQDSMRHLYAISIGAGVKTVVLGNLYRAGSSIARHWKNAKGGRKDYIYQKNTEGTWAKMPKATLLDGLRDEKWDYIVMQEFSGYAGLPKRYNARLTKLVRYVKRNKTNKKAKLAWHMTYAYQKGCQVPAFRYYKCKQMRMYKAIIKTTKRKIKPRKALSIVIPAATSMQNIRTGYVTDKQLTRDKRHLSYGLGSYFSGLCWFAAITGYGLEHFSNAPGRPEPVDAADWPIMQESITNALKKPYAVTRSAYVK